MNKPAPKLLTLKLQFIDADNLKHYYNQAFLDHLQQHSDSEGLAALHTLDLSAYGYEYADDSEPTPQTAALRTMLSGVPALCHNLRHLQLADGIQVGIFRLPSLPALVSILLSIRLCFCECG